MPAAPSSGPRVLVVDDNDINRLVLTRILEVLGYRPRQAEDGAKAVAAVAAGGIDAVLMDVQMPVMDGLVATRAIRTAGHRLPVIGVSAHGLPEDVAAAREAGMDDYLIKPIAMDALRQVLQQRLGRQDGCVAPSAR